MASCPPLSRLRDRVLSIARYDQRDRPRTRLQSLHIKKAVRARRARRQVAPGTY